MLSAGKNLGEIYDLFAIRVIVKKVEECYTALGLIHSLFTPVQDRFKDYIATPKSNMYQSLHTTVVGIDGRKVEVQIRTDEMHRTAEEGVAAHWRYKEGESKDDELEKNLSFLREVLEWQHETHDPQEFMENLRIDLFHDEVFVFSPKGDLYKLPSKSTPVDFAFAVHTDVGFHCIGAKVNSRIVPIDYQLKSGDSVEIITSKNQKPNPDWIKFTRTSKARSRVKKWLKDSLAEQSEKLGEEIVANEFKKFKIDQKDIDLEKAAQQFGYNNTGLLFSALGRGDLTVQSVISKVSPEKLVTFKEQSFLNKFINRARGSAKGVRVQGFDNFLINFAKCCQPVPGDKILGFVSQGRGVIVHRSNCKNIVRLLENSEKLVEVDWDVEKDKHFLARIHLLAEDRKNFLLEVSEKISRMNTNIVSIDLSTSDSIVNSNLIIQVRDVQHLNKVISSISKVRGMIAVERRSSSEYAHPDYD